LVHKVSRGSKFNQIYIPSNKEKEFEPGDLVEVKLLKKKTRIYYSNNLEKLAEFKKNLIEEIFKFLAGYIEINQVFIFGSFLTKKIGYNDIDVLILTQRKNNNLDNKVYNDLINKFNLNFHIISFNEQICPLTRSMLYYHVSDKEFKIPIKTTIDENHIRFLLMMPEDLLEVDLDYGIEYYNALRKLCVIKKFLMGKEISPNNIDSYLENLIDKRVLDLLKRNEILDKNILRKIKNVIKDELEKIYGGMNYGKKR